MARSSQSRDVAQTTPADFPSAPPSPHVLNDANSFALQAIMEMQKSLGEVKSEICHVKTSVDGMKSKVDQLVNWKNMIFGGAIVLGVVISVLSYVIGKGLDYVTFQAPSQRTQSASPPPQQVPTGK